MSAPSPPRIHEAELAPGPLGVVWYGPELSFDDAVAHRQVGLNVVVRGDDVDANRTLAAAIEVAVGLRTGPQKPHRRSGPHTLPHFHQVSRIPDGHCFYETDNPAKESEEAAMRYFTPELIVQLGSDEDAVARAAEQEWDRRLQEYEENLSQLEAELPEHVRAFNNLLLHDARVYSLARQGDQLILIRRKDIPPRDLVLVTYTLADEPSIDKEALPRHLRSEVMDFDYDEFGVLLDGGKTVFTQSILFSNGWEVQLRFHDVRFVLADPLFAAPELTASSRSA